MKPVLSGPEDIQVTQTLVVNSGRYSSVDPRPARPVPGKLLKIVRKEFPNILPDGAIQTGEEQVHWKGSL